MGDGVFGVVLVSCCLFEIGINYRLFVFIKFNLLLKEDNIILIVINNIECIKSLGIYNFFFLIKLIYVMYYLLKYELKFNDIFLKYIIGEIFNNF